MKTEAGRGAGGGGGGVVGAQTPASLVLIPHICLLSGRGRGLPSRMCAAAALLNERLNGVRLQAACVCSLRSALCSPCCAAQGAAFAGPTAASPSRFVLPSHATPPLFCRSMPEDEADAGPAAVSPRDFVDNDEVRYNNLSNQFMNRLLRSLLIHGLLVCWFQRVPPPFPSSPPPLPPSSHPLPLVCWVEGEPKQKAPAWAGRGSRRCCLRRRVCCCGRSCCPRAPLPPVAQLPHPHPHPHHPALVCCRLLRQPAGQDPGRVRGPQGQGLASPGWSRPGRGL